MQPHNKATLNIPKLRFGRQIFPVPMHGGRNPERGPTFDASDQGNMADFKEGTTDLPLA